MTINDYYLITGASGFIGSHLVDALLAKNIPASHITLLVRATSNLHYLPKKPFRIIRGDIRNPTITALAAKKATYIYHAAAVSGFQGESDNDYLSVNVEGTKNLLTASKHNALKKFIYISTIAVYGLPAWVGKIIDWDESRPHTYSEIYGKSKERAELLVKTAHRKWNIPYVIVRPSSVYGPRDKGQLYGLYKAIYRRYFVMIGSGKNLMDMVFVNDLVRGIIQAASSNFDVSEYILSSDAPISFEKISTSIAKSLHTSIPLYTLPYSLALPISAAFDATWKTFGKRAPIFPSRVKVMTTSYTYSCAKAKRELGYRPNTSFIQGAAITGKWYRKHEYL